MLPVVICEPDVAARDMWMDLLQEIVRKDYPSVRVEMLPGEEKELSRMLGSEDGIMLVILAISEAAAGGVNGCIERFLNVMEHNRDNYTILCVHDAACLNEVLSRCMRPAGVMVIPFQREFMAASLRRILKDYSALHQPADDGQYLTVNSSNTVHRIACRDILYLEAQDKLLNITTDRHVLTVRASLNALADQLPEGFVRCHRSYIVNSTHINRFDATKMMLYLSSQECLPVSRSYKDALREMLKTGSRG